MIRSLSTLSLVALGLAPLLGCGGGSSSPTDAGTFLTGSGGTSGGIPPASQGSASLYLTSATMPAGAVCAAVSHWVNVPFAREGGQTTTAATRSAVAVDGADGMIAHCSVKDVGGRFHLSADLEAPATDTMGQMLPPTIVLLSTTIAPNEAGATGSITIQDNKTPTHYISDSCTFSVQSQPQEQLQIAPGRIWASVACPTLHDPNSADTNAVCQIARGFVTLENCAQ